MRASVPAISTLSSLCRDQILSCWYIYRLAARSPISVRSLTDNGRITRDMNCLRFVGGLLPLRIIEDEWFPEVEQFSQPRRPRLEFCKRIDLPGVCFHIS